MLDITETLTTACQIRTSPRRPKKRLARSPADCLAQITPELEFRHGPSSPSRLREAPPQTHDRHQARRSPSSRRRRRAHSGSRRRRSWSRSRDRSLTPPRGQTPRPHSRKRARYSRSSSSTGRDHQHPHSLKESSPQPRERIVAQRVSQNDLPKSRGYRASEGSHDRLSLKQFVLLLSLLLSFFIDTTDTCSPLKWEMEGQATRRVARTEPL